MRRAASESYASNTNAGELRFTSWSPGKFGAFAAIGNGAAAIGSPALAASSARFDLAYHATDLKHYFARYVGSWGPIAEPIGAGVDQSFGPTSASIALLGGDSVVAFADNSGLPADRSRVGGTWQGAHIHNLGDAGDSVAVAPTIVAPAGGPSCSSLSFAPPIRMCSSRRALRGSGRRRKRWAAHTRPIRSRSWRSLAVM